MKFANTNFVFFSCSYLWCHQIIKYEHNDHCQQTLALFLAVIARFHFTALPFLKTIFTFTTLFGLCRAYGVTNMKYVFVLSPDGEFLLFVPHFPLTSKTKSKKIRGMVTSKYPWNDCNGEKSKNARKTHTNSPLNTQIRATQKKKKSKNGIKTKKQYNFLSDLYFGGAHQLKRRQYTHGN